MLIKVDIALDAKNKWHLILIDIRHRERENDSKLKLKKIYVFMINYVVKIPGGTKTYCIMIVYIKILSWFESLQKLSNSRSIWSKSVCFFNQNHVFIYLRSNFDTFFLQNFKYFLGVWACVITRNRCIKCKYVCCAKK